MKNPLQYLPLVSVCMLLSAGSIFAEPILALDFNSGTGAPSPTQPGWKAFAPVSASNQTGPIVATYTGLDTALSTGNVTVTVANGTSAAGTGTLSSRDRVLMVNSVYPNYYLYRDYVSTTVGPMTVEIAGLKPSTAYLLSYTAYDDSNARKLVVTNYTGGSAGVSATLQWSANTVFTAQTSEDLLTKTLAVTSDSAGKATLRITSGDANSGTLISGLVISKTPETWHLTANQTGTDDWTAARLAQWNSSVTGGGSSPSSINVVDTYVHDQGTNHLRTPSATSTFTGGLLALGGSAYLTLKVGSATMATIPQLYTTGGVIEQGVSGVTQRLNVGYYEVNSGTTVLTAATGRGLSLTAGTLYGAGSFNLTGGGGTFLLNFTDASDFTGAITLSSGTLSIQTRLATKGSLNIASTATVILNQPVYVTALKIGGAQLAAGTYSYASLSASYPTIFTSGTSAGQIIVYAIDTAGPARMGGVNLSIAEWGTVTPGVNGKYPTEAEFDYYLGKGLKLIRLPFRWERMQPTLNGELDSIELGRMDAVVGYARARGMKLILDLHNYDKYNGTLVGSSTVPNSAFRDVWRRLADHYKSETAIYGYGLMNEPNSTGGLWPASAQEATWGIREVDTLHYVVVGGDSWSGAYSWESSNFKLNVLDPVGRLIYEAHNYFVSDLSLTYDQAGAYPTIGIDRVRPFLNWLKFKNAKGYIGEFGVPYNDSRWLTCLDQFLAYASSNGLSTTYWAGGPGWSDTDLLNCEPHNGVDRPQITILQNYP